MIQNVTDVTDIRNHLLSAVNVAGPPFPAAGLLSGNNRARFASHWDKNGHPFEPIQAGPPHSHIFPLPA
jgi:hypothetical protein